MRARGWRTTGVLAAALATLVAAAPAQSSANALTLHGEWRNVKNTVHIRAYPCGDAVCGTVIWASPKAQAAAQKGGTAALEGTQIFREFRPEGDGHYAGKVFVPTVGRTFSGKLKVTRDDRLVGKGCILGGLFCKSTTWLRLN